MSKGQVFSLDLIVAVGLFIFILLATYWFESSTVSRIDSSVLMQSLTSTAYLASNSLVLTGEPAGLASSPNSLSPVLVDSFFSSNYTLAKGSLCIRSPFEFHVSLLDSGKRPLLELGPSLSSSADSVVLDRIVIYNSSLSILRVEVWHE